MRLGREEIYKRYKKGEIIIEPFNEELLQECSYDVTLDDHFIMVYENFTVNPMEDDLRNFSLEIKSDTVVVKPLYRILARTRERIGSAVENLTSQLASKSSWGRWGLEVCGCAGYGDPGYATNWTLEIFNKNSFSVVITKGMVIGQIYFDEVIGCNRLYESKYNNEDLDVFSRMYPKNIKRIN